jgi:hypothetical protein
VQIKYMGSADIRRLEKGEAFGGRLNEKYALDRDIEWNWENNHVIDTDDFDGVHEEFWSLLLGERFPEAEDGPQGAEFIDVTDKVRIPTNAAQQMWRASGKNEEAPANPRQSEADSEAATAGGTTGSTPAKAKATTAKST